MFPNRFSAMAASAAQVLQLRSDLEARFGSAILPSTAPDVEVFEGFRTGIHAIDGLLPHGLQRGTISVWTGEASAGLTAALRALVLHSCGEGARVAVIDAALTLDASFGCTPAGPVAGLWVVRPPDAADGEQGAWAAESLLRAGVFDLVVLDGCPVEAVQAHRLRALARERNAAVVVSTAGNRESGNREQWFRSFSSSGQRGRDTVPCSLERWRRGGRGSLFPAVPRRPAAGVPARRANGRGRADAGRSVPGAGAGAVGEAGGGRPGLGGTGSGGGA